MNTSDFRTIVIVMLFVILAFVVSIFGEAQAGEYRLGSMNNSHHFSGKDGEPYVEKHRGIFAEVRTGEEHWLGIMKYTNSFNVNSDAVYLLTEYTATEHVQYGYMIGIVSGYAYLETAPWGALTLTIGRDHLKGRAIIIPGVVVGYQLLVEF